MIKQILENQQKLMKRLQSIEDNQNGRKRKREDSNSENPAKRVDLDTLAVDQSGQVENLTDESEMASSTGLLNQKSGKCFRLKHTFKNVSKLENNVQVNSEEQEHFGVTWSMYIRRNNKHLALRTRCHNKTEKGIRSIEVDCEVKMMSKSGNPNVRKTFYINRHDKIENIQKPYGWGFPKFKSWNMVEQEFLVDDSLTFEVSFKIKSMTGIYKNNLRSFDDMECSDVVLIVQDKKFHVLKLYLATHSSYFKAMFLGMFGESKKSEIPLTGIDADDFQNYLEVLYGDDAIDEYTVEGILMVSDMFDTQIVIKKCQQFLMKESKKTVKKKSEMSVRFNLEELKKKCLSEIKTIDDIRRVIPGDIKDMDPSIMAILLEKALNPNVVST